MTLAFSPTPGCWERHLQRRHDNPLFSPARRRVSDTELQRARQRDSEERQRCHLDFHVLLREAAQLPPQAENEQLLDLKQRIERLYLQCAACGLGLEKEKEGLARLNEVITRSLRTATADDGLAQTELDKEAMANRLHRELLETPIVAHLLIADSPIEAEELVPTLLSEDIEALRVAVDLFDATQLLLMARQARELEADLQQRGALDATLAQRIAVLVERAQRAHPGQPDRLQ